MNNDKTATAPNHDRRYHGQSFLIPAEVLPETVSKDPSFIVTGQFVEIEGKKFYRISRWHKK